MVEWGLLLGLTTVNCGAASVTLYTAAQTLNVAAQMQADFRAAAEPIAKMVSMILDRLRAAE